MEYLAFRLYAPLSSWGEPAVGEHRPSHEYPGRSAMLGLLCAALGIRRHEETRIQALTSSLGLAVAVHATGTLLRDYHTAQVPTAKDLRKRPHRTRADELAVPRTELNTILSTRDYRQDGLYVVLVWLREDSGWTLQELREALLRPRFALYLGRKCCPPALPLHPHLVVAEDLRGALAATTFPRIDGLRGADAVQRVAFDADARMEPGFDQAAQFSVTRKDQPLSRRRWQFEDRIERVAVLAPEPAGDRA